MIAKEQMPGEDVCILLEECERGDCGGSRKDGGWAIVGDGRNGDGLQRTVTCNMAYMPEKVEVI